MIETEDLRSLQITLPIYIIIFILKLSVYILSDVMALLAEALHTLSELFVAGFLLVAILYSRIKGDEAHQYGHARAQYDFRCLYRTNPFRIYKKGGAK